MGSLPSFAKWLLFTFQVIYLIEAGDRILGFIGLYGLKPGGRLRLAIAIFDQDCRGKGYGTAALGLLLPFLREKGLCEEVFVEVPQENERSLSFFAKAGFEKRERDKDVLLLAKKLTPSG